MKSYINHWDDKFQSQEWGKYPPEELVRFIGRNYKNLKRNDISILEIGCGPGANLWFLHREGYKVSGIDGSKTAIEKAETRLNEENIGLNKYPQDLKVGNFSNLPWRTNEFDLVVDIFSLYANTRETIKKTLDEIERVLKPEGKLFCKLWGTKTTGFNEGKEIEKYTFDELKTGPCANMGISHFFDRDEISEIFSKFKIINIDTIFRSDSYSDCEIEEYVCTFQSTKG
jgi:ubiquinone/menaquinone biosynthesis C-methylase UbiE